MGWGPKRHRRRAHAQAQKLIANAFLAGMKVEKHESVSRKWAGPSHTIYATTIKGVVVYRASLAALAGVWMRMLPPEGPKV